MSMNTTYLDNIANHGAGLITYIGLVDDTGTELSGGDPAYERQSVSWQAASDGTIRPDSDLTFDVPGGATVAGWRGYDALTGGTNFGGASVTNESFDSQGQYTLLASQTAIHHQAA